MEMETERGEREIAAQRRGEERGAEKEEGENNYFVRACNPQNITGDAQELTLKQSVIKQSRKHQPFLSTPSTKSFPNSPHFTFVLEGKTPRY